MKKIVVMNGPNLNMLGVREPGVYGSETLADLERMICDYGARRGVQVECFQANSEGKLIRKIHATRGTFDGIVYNPGAHTHYSYALRDALGSVDVPCIEVHISDVDAREPFRRVSVIAPVCAAQVKGRGFAGYCDAIDLLLEGVSGRLGEGFEQLYPKGQVIVAGRNKLVGDAELAQESSQQAFLPTAQQASIRDVSADFAKADEGTLSQPGAAARRLERLRAACKADNLDAFFVRDTSNIAWLSAFDGVFDDESAHALLVTECNAVLHTDSRYSEAARAAACDEGVLVVDDARKTHAAFVAENFTERGAGGAVAETAASSSEVEAAVPAFEKATLGIEDSLTLSEFRALEASFDQASYRPHLRETSNFVLNLRAVKEPSELARLKAAQAITDAAFAHIVAFMKVGMTEREVQIELEDFMRRAGAEGLAFPSIVATGANGASPHAIAGATRLEAGQCVVMDFGARAFGYCSDMTRTVFLGQPDERLRSAYDALCAANEQVEAALKPGVTGRAMHELAEQVLAQAGFGGKMGHGLGHGVGIDIHEEPVLSPRNESSLVAGNVVTVEPGIYLPGEFGMRLEDFGVVTPAGFEVFTQSAHDMVVL